MNARGPSAPRPFHVCFVCSGNICRSPYAEAAIRAGLAARGLWRVDVRSAGFIGPDRPAPATALEAAAARGRDLSAHRSRLIAPGDLVPGTLILVMDQRQRDAILRLAPAGVEVALLGDFDPEPIGRRNILDPIECPRPVFDAVYERLDRCAAGLLDAIAPAIPPAAPRTPAP